jgi:hypothetical protein
VKFGNCSGRQIPSQTACYATIPGCEIAVVAIMILLTGKIQIVVDTSVRVREIVVSKSVGRLTKIHETRISKVVRNGTPN